MIFTLAATAIVGALGLAAGAISYIAAGLAFAASLALNYLNRPKKRNYSAVQGQIQYGADVPAGTVFGTSKVKGHRVFYAKYGEGNKFNADVFVLANGWCEGLEGVYFYGKKQTLVPKPITGNEAANYEVQGFGNNLQIRFYDGRPGQKADMKLVAETAGLGKTWKATSVGAGQTYVVVRREYDDRFSKGRPELEWVLRGLREYDPRKDSTYPGGSGPQRLDDPSTWVRTETPAIHRLNYLLGLKGLSSGRTLVGVGKPLAAIDVASHIAAANVSDTVRNGKPTYACSLYVQADDDHSEILKEFEDAMAGYGMNRYGLSGVIAGAPQIPVADIGPLDIRTDEGKEVSFRKSAFELYNSISGQFTSKVSNWKPESLKTVTVNADVAADGRKRQTGNDFLQVTDPDIAQYLLNIRYRQNRKGGSAKLPVSRRLGLKADVGTWVTYVGKTWLVTGRAFNAKLKFTLTLAETGADIYDEGGIAPGPVIIPPVDPVNPSLASTVSNFTAEAGMISGAAGYDTPVLRFRWTPPNDPTVTAVRFFYKIDGQELELQDQCLTPEDGEYTTPKGVQSGKVYVARATITTIPDRLKTFTTWATTASATGYLTVMAAVQELSQNVRDDLKRRQQEMDQVRQQVEFLAANTGSANAEDVVERQRFIKQFGSTRALIVKESGERVSENAALAYDMTLVEARIDNAEGQIAGQASVLSDTRAEVTSLNGQVSAVSSALTFVSAQAQQGSADGMAQWKAEAGPAGYTVSYALQGKVSAGGTMRYGGIFLDVNATGARWRMIGDQIVFADSSGNVLALFQPGTNFLNNAVIKNLTSDNIQVGSIDSPSLAFGAVTQYQPLNYEWTKTIGGAQSYTEPITLVATFTISNPAGTPLIEFLSLTATANLSGAGSRDADIWISRDGVIIGEARQQSNGTTTFSLTSYIDEGKTTYTYRIWQQNALSAGSSSSATVTIKSRSGVLFWKR